MYDLEILVAAFESQTLPRSEWTHRAHLLVALWYLNHYPFEQAVRRIREGIQKYNDSQGIEMTPKGGYHETMTMFYIYTIADFLRQHMHVNSPDELAALLLEHPCAEKHYPLQFYSRDRLFSWEAKISYVEPDLQEVRS